jgi:disulfide bond formation protein DsbB
MTAPDRITPQRLAENAPALILIASVVILGSAMASQYIGGLVPCNLCLVQRWPYWLTIAASVVALLAVTRPGLRRALVGLCGVAFAVGAGVAFYHVGVEEGWFAGPASCTPTTGLANSIEELRRQLLATPPVRCDEVQWALFGISMAGFNLIASVILATASFTAVVMTSPAGAKRDG